MAMYVLLSFESDEDAMSYVDNMLEMAKESSGGLHLVREIPGGVVEGIYKKPTKFCNRLDPIHGNHRVIGWTQGQKYGWWICAKCGLPSPVAARNVPNEISGYNLLERLFVVDPVVSESTHPVETLSGEN